MLCFGRCWSPTPSRQPLFETSENRKPGIASTLRNTKIVSNRSKGESRKIDSESPIRIATYRCLKLLCRNLRIARLNSHNSEPRESQFRIADSMSLSSRIQLVQLHVGMNLEKPLVCICICHKTTTGESGMFLPSASRRAVVRSTSVCKRTT